MSSGRSSIKLALPFALLSSIFCSCASSPCPAGPEQLRIVQVNHIRGGDAPTIVSLEVYESGFLRLNHVGAKTFCSPATEEEISGISDLVDPVRVQELEWTIQGVYDAEWIQIFADGAEARLLLNPPPEELLPLLRALDSLFRAHFGRRYDNPLLSHP
jgi:hypothetical protein